MKSTSATKPKGGRKSLERLNAIPRSDFVKLIDLPNVGRAFAGDLHLLGIQRPQQLIGRDAFALFDELCNLTQQRHDPCVIDQFIAVIRFMQGEDAKPWWEYTPERKKEIEKRVASSRNVKQSAPTPQQ